MAAGWNGQTSRSAVPTPPRNTHLDEEKSADEKLSELALGGLNEEAEGEEDDEDEEKPKQASARKK